MNQSQDNDIDLLDVLEKLWDDKWLIISFVIVAILFGASILLSKESMYESELSYSVETLPPFYTQPTAKSYITPTPVRDFERMFYSQDQFNIWKKDNEASSIVYDDFSLTEIIDGYIISKEDDALLLTLSAEKDNFHILVRTNQLSRLNDFYNYANHINNILKDQYTKRAQSEVDGIQERLNRITSESETQDRRYETVRKETKRQGIDNSTMDKLLTLENYIMKSKNGSNLFNIRRPTMPVKVSPKTSVFLILSAISGGVIGVFFVLFRNAIRNRKARMTN